MKIVLDIDDLSPSIPNADLLVKLKEHYPNLKITAFTIPADVRTFHDSRDKEDWDKIYVPWTQFLNENPWIEIAPHGFFHVPGEMLCSFEKAEKIVKAGENLFEKYDIPYVKIFKAPKWQMSPEAYAALKYMGYIVATDRNNQMVPVTGVRTYTFNWSFEELFPKHFPLVKGHGHMAGMYNAIDITFTNLLKMPTDAEFMTVSEYLKYEKEPQYSNDAQQNGVKIVQNTSAEQIFRKKGTQRLGA